jgi:uncharacterized protein
VFNLKADFISYPVYVTSEVSSEAGPVNGIQYYGRVDDIKVNGGKVRFVVES